MTWSAGTFSRTGGATNWGDDRDAGTEIEAGLHDTHDEDLAQGINDCLHKGGQNAATANISMGSNKLTNLADATVDSDALPFGMLAVRQVVIANSTSDQSGTTSYAAYMSVTITPAFSDSNIIIIANAYAAVENSSAAGTAGRFLDAQLYRSTGTPASITTASIGRTIHESTTAAAASGHRLSMIGTEAPGAGTHTYQLRFKANTAGILARLLGSTGTQATIIAVEVRP